MLLSMGFLFGFLALFAANAEFNSGLTGVGYSGSSAGTHFDPIGSAVQTNWKCPAGLLVCRSGDGNQSESDGKSNCDKIVSRQCRVTLACRPAGPHLSAKERRTRPMNRMTAA
jgi:hypothetical protein